MTQCCPKRIQCQSDKNNKPDKNGNSTYLSISGASKILSLDSSTVRYYIIRCRIRAFKSGGRWWVNKNDIETLKIWLDY